MRKEQLHTKFYEHRAIHIYHHRTEIGIYLNVCIAKCATVVVIVFRLYTTYRGTAAPHWFGILKEQRQAVTASAWCSV